MLATTNEEEQPMNHEEARQKNEAIERYLGDLGATSDEVAATLKKRGCTGIRYSAFCCPVAEYLKQRVPEVQLQVTQMRVSSTSLTSVCSPQCQ